MSPERRSMSGGDKSTVKNVPFGTRNPVSSDYAHLKDQSVKKFAIDLGQDKKDPRKKAPGRAAEESEEEGGPADDDSPSKSNKPKGKLQTAVDPEELRAFLQEEGVDPDGQNLCPLPKCMESISKIILNDKNSKVERQLIMLEIEEMNALLGESLKEEELATANLTALTKEISGLENTVENQREKVKALEQKKEDLENEKKTFNGRVSVLEKDQRSFAAKLKVAQQKFAKVVWLKPGQKYDEDDGHLPNDIHHIKSTTARDLDEISHPATVGYDACATNLVRDFNERAQGPLHYSNYVNDSIDMNHDLMSAATTSRLAFLEKKRRIKGLTKGGCGGSGKATPASTLGRPGSPINVEESTIVSQLTVEEGGTVTGTLRSPKRVPHIKKASVNGAVRTVHEYLLSGASQAMTRSPSKTARGGTGSTQSVILGTGTGSSHSVGPGTAGHHNLWMDVKADPSQYARSALVMSSMSRSGNKNPASIMGSPVKAIKALKAAREGMQHTTLKQRGGGVPPDGSHNHGHDDDIKTIATMSTLGHDASVFDVGGEGAGGGEHFFTKKGGGSASASGSGNESFTSYSWEGGGAVGGAISSHNRAYGTYKDKGRIRTVVDGVGTLNYKPRTVQDMLEDDNFQ